MQLNIISKFQIKVDIIFFLSLGLDTSSTVPARGSRVLNSLVEMLLKLVSSLTASASSHVFEFLPPAFQKIPDHILMVHPNRENWAN